MSWRDGLAGVHLQIASLDSLGRDATPEFTRRKTGLLLDREADLMLRDFVGKYGDLALSWPSRHRDPLLVSIRDRVAVAPRNPGSLRPASPSQNDATVQRSQGAGR
jgi:hypothetical protein